MKLPIYIKRINKNLPLPSIKVDDSGRITGDYIDLYCSETTYFTGPYNDDIDRDNIASGIIFDIKTIKLGVAMLLPNGTYAELVSRSSTGKKLKISLINGEGIIDHTFCGNEDEWRFPAIAWADTAIKEGVPFCQFSIKLSQMATAEEKKAFMEADGVEIIEVDELPSTVNRGGGCIREEAKR